MARLKPPTSRTRTRKPRSNPRCARSTPRAAASTRWRRPCVTGWARPSPPRRADPRRARPRHRDRHGQIRPCRAQDRRDLRLHRHAGAVRASRRGEPRRPRHDRRTTWSSRCPIRARRRSSTDIVAYSRRFRIPLIAMTAQCRQRRWPARPTSCWLLPPAPEACPIGLAPTTSTLMQLALGDALAVALLERRGFTAVDFGVLPSGRQARRACCKRCANHACRRGGAADRARHAACREAILVMTAKGFGCVGITDAAASWSASSPTAICAATCATICSTRASTTS